MSDNEIDKGGPAFPVPDEANVMGCTGMDLRDYFAIHTPNPFNCSDNTAYAGRVSGLEVPGYVDAAWWYKAEAIARYKKADAMLEARKL